MSDSPNAAAQRAFPVPLWAATLTLLIVEFSVWGWLAHRYQFRYGETACGVALLIVLPLLARALIALLSYALSRWKGSPVPSGMRMGPAAWARFFLIEYGHLCTQNLILIPLRGLFHTASERGKFTGSGPVMLMQAGYINNGAVWFFTARALEQRGFRVYTIDQPAFASIDLMAALLSKRIDEVLALTGESQLTLVAHSMGGLICRAYLRQCGGAKVLQLVTLGSPHHGTYHAYFASGANGRQMRPGNGWLTTLAETPVTIPFTSIFSVHDTVISPQESSRMPDAVNIRLSRVGHVSMPSGGATRTALIAAMSATNR